MELSEKRRPKADSITEANDRPLKANDKNRRHRAADASSYPSPSKPSVDNYGVGEIRRARMLEASNAEKKQKTEYITKYEQVRDSIKEIKTELEAIETRRDIAEDYEFDRLHGRAKLNETKGERVAAKLGEIAGKDVTFWLDIRDISHDQWQKCLDFEHHLVEERNRHFKEVTDLRNCLTKRLEWFKEKTFLRIKSLEQQVESHSLHATRLETELGMRICDHESHLMNQEIKVEEALKAELELNDIKDLSSAIKKIEKLNAARKTLMKKNEDMHETAKHNKRKLDKCLHKLKAAKVVETEFLDRTALLIKGIEELMVKSNLSPGAKQTIGDHLRSSRLKQAVTCIVESVETVSRKSSKDTLEKKSEAVLKKSASRRLNDQKPTISNEPPIPKPPKQSPTAATFLTVEPELSSPVADQTTADLEIEREQESMRLSLTLSTTPLSQPNFQELQATLVNFIEKSLADNSLALIESTSVHDLTITELLQLQVQVFGQTVAVVDLIKDGLAAVFALPKAVTVASTPTNMQNSSNRRPALRSFKLKLPKQISREENVPEGTLDSSKDLVVQSFFDSDKDTKLTAIQDSKDESLRSDSDLSDSSKCLVIKHPEISPKVIGSLNEEAIIRHSSSMKQSKLQDSNPTKHGKLRPKKPKVLINHDVSFLKVHLPRQIIPNPTNITKDLSAINLIRWRKLLTAMLSKTARNLGNKLKIKGNEQHVWDVLCCNIKHVQHRLIKFRSVPSNIEITNSNHGDEFRHPSTLVSGLRHRSYVIDPLSTSHRRVNSNAANGFTTKRRGMAKRISLSLSQELSHSISGHDDAWSVKTPRYLQVLEATTGR